MFNKHQSINPIVSLGTIVTALLFIVQFNANAQERPGDCNSTISDQPVEIFSEGIFEDGPATQINETQLQADIVQFRFESEIGTFSLDEDQKSSVTVTSRSADGFPFYPADAVVSLRVKFVDNAGNEWLSEDQADFVLQGEADSFPPENAWSTELANAVTFTFGGESFELQTSSAVVQAQ